MFAIFMAGMIIGACVGAGACWKGLHKYNKEFSSIEDTFEEERLKKLKELKGE